MSKPGQARACSPACQRWPPLVSLLLRAALEATQFYMAGSNTDASVASVRGGVYNYTLTITLYAGTTPDTLSPDMVFWDLRSYPPNNQQASVTAVSPGDSANPIATSGGTTITLTGTYFGPADSLVQPDTGYSGRTNFVSAVIIGGTQFCTGVVVTTSETQLTCTAPPGAGRLSSANRATRVSSVA